MLFLWKGARLYMLLNCILRLLWLLDLGQLYMLLHCILRLLRLLELGRLHMLLHCILRLLRLLELDRLYMLLHCILRLVRLLRVHYVRRLFWWFCIRRLLPRDRTRYRGNNTVHLHCLLYWPFSHRCCQKMKTG